MNVFSDELFNIYLERIYQDIVDIERHFLQIKGWILKNLSLVDWWENGGRHFTEQIYAYRDEYEDHESAAFRKELTEKCEVSNENLPDYISQVDHCLTIALLVDSLLRRTTNYFTFTGIRECEQYTHVVSPVHPCLVNRSLVKTRFCLTNHKNCSLPNTIVSVNRDSTKF